MHAMTRYIGMSCNHVSGTAREFIGKPAVDVAERGSRLLTTSSDRLRRTSLLHRQFPAVRSNRTAVNPVASGEPGIFRDRRIARRTETDGHTFLLTTSAHDSWLKFHVRSDDRVPI